MIKIPRKKKKGFKKWLKGVRGIMLNPEKPSGGVDKVMEDLYSFYRSTNPVETICRIKLTNTQKK